MSAPPSNTDPYPQPDLWFSATLLQLIGMILLYVLFASLVYRLT